MNRAGHRLSLLAGAIFSAAGFAAPASAGEAPNLHLATVGRLSVADLGSCGFVAFAQDIAMTAAHCVVESGQAEPVDPERIRVTVKAEGHREQVLGVTDIATDPSFSYEGDPTRATVGRDVALLRLDGPIDAGYERVVAPPDGLSYVGLLPVEEGATEFQAEACPVKVESGNILVLDCLRTPGTSGSPIFAMVGGKRAVVGVISAGGVRSDGTDITFGTNVVPSFSRLSWLRADRGAVGKF